MVAAPLLPELQAHTLVRPWHLTRAMPWSRCGDQTRTLLQYLAQSSGALLQPSAGESLPVQESSLWRACHLLIPQAAPLHPPEPSWSSSPWECAASWPPLTLRGLADTLLLELQGVLGSAHRAIVHLFIPSPAFSWLSYELRNSKATSIRPLSAARSASGCWWPKSAGSRTWVWRTCFTEKRPRACHDADRGTLSAQARRIAAASH